MYGSPNGQELQRCATIERVTGLLTDNSCNDKFTSFCEIDKHIPFVLRGLPESIRLLLKDFLLLKRILFNKQVVFQSYHGFFILFDAKSENWVIYEHPYLPSENQPLEDVRILARLDSDSPLGMKTWNLEEWPIQLKLTKVCKKVYER